MPYDMHSKPPQVVFGFHGCDRLVFDEVVRGRSRARPGYERLRPARRGRLPLGNSHDRAPGWAARSRSVSTPAVIGSAIDLSRCLNLIDSEYTDILAAEFEIMRGWYERLGIPLPTNGGRGDGEPLRRLDCAVIEHLHTFYDEIPEARFDTLRGLFSEVGPAFPGSCIRTRTHVQICVRNPNCIKGYFAPRRTADGYDLPQRIGLFNMARPRRERLGVLRPQRHTPALGRRVSST